MSVYFIQAKSHSAVKIGIAVDVEKRCKEIQSAHHEELTIIRILDGYRETENWLHCYFADKRIRGEWFTFSEEMMTISPPIMSSENNLINMREPKNITGGELRSALWMLGLSQKDFAAKAGIRPESVSRYIRGHAPVPRLVEMAVTSLKNTEAEQ
jgi:hypothetical protein